MKNNTKITKQHIVSALSSVPNDNSLMDVRYFLKKALGEIERIESKRQRAQTTQIQVAKEWEEKMKLAAQSNLNPRASLEALEKMIEEEQKKLNKKTEEEKTTSTTTLID